VEEREKETRMREQERKTLKTIEEKETHTSQNRGNAISGLLLSIIVVAVPIQPEILTSSLGSDT
jgi:hypothetical protein